MRYLSRQDEGQPRRTGKRGFSLIELLIVVAIILIIAAIAVPSLLRAKIAANQAAAVENLRTVVTANVVYYTFYKLGYTSKLSYLGGTTGPTSYQNAELVDPLVASGLKSGYILTYTPGPLSTAGTVESYTLLADPAVPGTTGTRHFFVDESGVIRFSDTGPANAGDPAIQ